MNKLYAFHVILLNFTILMYILETIEYKIPGTFNHGMLFIGATVKVSLYVVYILFEIKHLTKMHIGDSAPKSIALHSGDEIKKKSQ